MISLADFLAVPRTWAATRDETYLYLPMETATPFTLTLAWLHDASAVWTCNGNEDDTASAN